MSVKYSVTELKNPGRPEEPSKFYAKAQVREVITIDRIASEIAFATSLTEGDVLNVIRNIPYRVGVHLQDGDLVDLGDLGRIQFQLKSRGADVREEFTRHHIKNAKIQFKPGKQLTQILGRLNYEQVIPVKNIQEAKRKAKDSEAQE